MMFGFHGWVQVSVDREDVHLLDGQEKMYSHQCERCGLLRHTIGPTSVRLRVETDGTALTYEPIAYARSTKRWTSYYPNGFRRCKPKEAA